MRTAEVKLDPTRWPRLHRTPLPVGTTFEYRDSSAHVLAAEEEERRRVSRELHDDLGQRLAVLELQIEDMTRRLGSDPAVASGLGKLRVHVGGLADDIHRICHCLHPAILDQLGLIAAVRSYCEEFTTWSGIKTRFNFCGVPSQIPSSMALCIYRVVQESLRNVAKHACAARAIVVLRGSGTGLQVVVKDTGRGFDLSEGRSKGLGLTSLSERVQLAGGTYSVRTAPGRGTRIQVTIPFAQTPETVLACAG